MEHQKHPPYDLTKNRECLDSPRDFDLMRQLTNRTNGLSNQLREATTAKKLRLFWEERSNDIHTREILAEAPNYIRQSWAIMRQLSVEIGLKGPEVPPEPTVMRQSYNEAGVPVSPRQPEFLSNYYRCRSAYCDKNGRAIPVDERLLRNAADQIVAWCRKAEAGKDVVADVPVLSPHGESVPDGPEPPNGFNWQGQTYRGMRPQVFQAVEFLWSYNTKRTAHADDLAEPVWRDREHMVSKEGLKSLRRDINRFFLDNDIPLHATVKNEYLSLEDGPPRIKAGKGSSN